MACPYFYPTAHLDERLWPHPPRLPLGDGYSGLCLAPGQSASQPDHSAIQQWCNLGYAREHCARFPGGAGPDANRFAVSSDCDNRIRIHYASEKDHRPHDHGTLEFDLAKRAFVTEHPNPTLRRQAEVYVESYLRRRHER